MHHDVLTTLMTISPACLSDPATRDALTSWHRELGAMLASASQWTAWTPPRWTQQRENSLGRLAAQVLADLAKTAMLHQHVCGTGAEPDTQGPLCEGEEGQDEGEGAGPAPVPVPDVTDVDTLITAEHLRPVRVLHPETGQDVHAV